MNADSDHTTSWFSSRAGRRYGLELISVVLAKLALLTLLYFLFIAPQPHADTTAAAIQQRLLDAQSAAPSGEAHDRP